MVAMQLDFQIMPADKNLMDRFAGQQPAGGRLRTPLPLTIRLHSRMEPLEADWRRLEREDNLSLVGTAVCSASALGLFPDLQAASDALDVSTQTLEPDMARAQWYRDAMSSYRETTEVLTPLFHALSARQMTGADR